MDFDHPPHVIALRERVAAFVTGHALPAEAMAAEQVTASGDPHHHPAALEALKERARESGLWNLFLPDAQRGAGLSDLEFAPLAEAMAHSALGPEALNCNAPDVPNMLLLWHHGTPQQRAEWLEPLLAGTVRSCFAMTEPAVAGSDPTLLETRAVRDGAGYVLNGRKWFATAAAHPLCRVAIVVAVTDPDAAPHQRATQFLVPMDAPGFSIVRALPVFNDAGGPGQCELLLEDVRVPAAARLGAEGSGFVLGQERLGPARIHHCMRAIGQAERALGLACERALGRTAHGSVLADKGVVQTWIAESRMAIEQARLFVLYAAWKMDRYGQKGARHEIGMLKTLTARMFEQVCDRAIQVFGAAGTTNDFPLARLWSAARTMRIFDGPDELHNAKLARDELRRVARERGLSAP